MKTIKCRYCKGLIENEDDIFVGNISNNPKKVIKGKFHKSKNCYKNYLENKKVKKEYKEKRKINDDEIKEWNNLYDYVRYEILDYKDGMQLSPYIRSKLQGLRVGDFTIKRGQTINNSKGYPYKIILITFQIMKLSILTSIKNKTFNDDNHKFNYVLKIIKNNINDVYRRYEEKRNEDRKLKNIKIDIPTENDKVKYKANTNLINNKVTNLLKDMF